MLPSTMTTNRFPGLRALGFVTLLACSFVPGCGEEPYDLPGPSIGHTSEALTLAQRKARYEKIRDAVNADGLDGKGYLFAGIAFDETGLAMCWSEATWACKGPNSADCGNGPVIAGSADGPCSAQQGGLGMFQFDAGTYSDTLAKYGNDVLTIDGQVAHAIDFVIRIVKISAYTTNAETDAKARQWILDFDLNNATLRDQWIKTVVNYYNGCPPSGSCWASRYKTYNEGLQQVVDETGLAYWQGVTDWKATYVSQSFPLASQPFELYPGQEKKGFIELRNDGKQTWKPGEVFLGTTEPRDGASPIAGPDWVSKSRAATVDASTPKGSTGKFSFTVKAPDKPGDYPQYFNLVREGVHWFSDSGQGGPKDNQLQVKVTVKPSLCAAGLGTKPTCDGDDVVTCDPATGKVTKTACPGGCVAGATGAECDDSPDGGGAAGKAGAAGSAGSSHDAGAGKAGAAGGQDGGHGAPIIQWPTSDDGGCSTAGGPGKGKGSLAVLIGAVALLLRRRRR